MHNDSILTISPWQLSYCSAIMNTDVKPRESQLCQKSATLSHRLPLPPPSKKQLHTLIIITRYGAILMHFISTLYLYVGACFRVSSNSKVDAPWKNRRILSWTWRRQASLEELAICRWCVEYLRLLRSLTDEQKKDLRNIRTVINTSPSLFCAET